MEDNAMPKRTLKGRLYPKSRKGRPRMRWLDDVESDLKKIEVKGWKEKIRDRKQWRLVVEAGFRGGQGSRRAVAPTSRQLATGCMTWVRLAAGVGIFLFAIATTMARSYQRALSSG
jgi:hypothetical protein